MSLKNTLEGFFKRSRKVTGMDIGTDSVKLVQLEGGSDGLQMTHFGLVEISRSNGKDNRGDVTQEATLEAIEKLLSESGVMPESVCTAVSGESVIVRPIPMPNYQTKDESEFEMAVRGEAKDFIPFEMDDVVFDYQKLGLRDSKSTGSEVLIVAVKKDLIERHLNLLSLAGLQPLIIDVDSIALVNAVIAGGNLDPEEPVAIVNIGDTVTNIAIMKNEMTRFTRDLAFGGRNITAALASEFDITYEEAEQLKRRCGLSALNAAGGEPTQETANMGVIQEVYQAIETLQQEEKVQQETSANADADPQDRRVSEICEHTIGDIVSEVKRSLLYYENQLDGEAISRIVLSGGSAKMLGVQDYFHNVLDIPTEEVNPFEKIQTPMTETELQEKGPLLGVGLGLALRNVINQ